MVELFLHVVVAGVSGLRRVKQAHIIVIHGKSTQAKTAPRSATLARARLGTVEHFPKVHHSAVAQTLSAQCLQSDVCMRTSGARLARLHALGDHAAFYSTANKAEKPQMNQPLTTK